MASKVSRLMAETETIYGGHKTALAKNGSRNIQFGRFTISATHVDFPKDTSEIEYADLGRFLLQMEGKIQWFLGDWLAYGQDHEWGKTYAKVASDFNYELDTLYHYSSLARKVKYWIRNPGLSPAHHRLVQSLPESEQKLWLGRAAAAKWKVHEMRAAMREEKKPLPEETGGRPTLPRPFELAIRRLNHTFEESSDDECQNMIEFLEHWIEALKRGGSAVE